METYKEIMYRNGYSLYLDGMAMKNIAKNSCHKEGPIYEHFMERSSELFRKSALLAACAKRAK